MSRLPRLVFPALVVALAADASAQVPYQRTFLGSSGNERVQGVAVDSAGRVYVTGHTSSSGFATTLPSALGGFDKTYNGGLDAYVAVLSPDLSQVLHWTMLGGSGEDRAYQVELDPLGQVVVVGFTDSPNFPRTAGPGLQGDWDVFVTRLSADLKQLRRSSVFGGSAMENPRGSFCIDAAGDVYIGGSTASLDFPATPGAHSTTHAPIAPDAGDAFVAKIGGDGLVRWATYLGGSYNDSAHSGCRLAADGGVVVAGFTNSPDFPATPGVYQPVFGGHAASGDSHIGDGFVAKLSADGSQLLWSTFLGGSDADAVAGNDSLELDGAGRPVLIGQTLSLDFPVTAGAFDTSHGGLFTDKYDAFVAILSADGQQLVASTFLGGEQLEEPSGLAIGPHGDVFLSGNTDSGNFPVTPDASQPLRGGGAGDGFVAKLTPDLRWLAYSTYIGGSGSGLYGDRGRGLTLTSAGDVILGGDTDSQDFPVTSGSFDTSFGGGTSDSFVDVERLSQSYPFGSGKLNSLGRTPILSINGAPSAANPSFALRVTRAVPNRLGVLAWSHSLIALPYQGGVRYIGLPVMRVPGIVALDAFGAAAIPLSIAPAMIGETRIYQLWHRDPQHADGTGAGLTNAVKLTFAP